MCDCRSQSDQNQTLLNESQVRAQAVRLFEENCGYGVMAKKPVAV